MVTQQTTMNEELSYFLKHIPGFVFLILLCITGSIGNVHAILVYWKRFKPTNRRTAVITLATVDLINCLVSMPQDMIVIRYIDSITSQFTCKFFLFIVHAVSLASILLLLLIALERFRKVCQPLKRQISQKKFRIICILVIIAAVVVSTPTLFFYGYEIVLGGTRALCRAENSMFYQIYYSILSVIIGMSLAICIFAYVTLGQKVQKMDDKMTIYKSSSFSAQDSARKHSINVPRKSSSFGNLHLLFKTNNAEIPNGRRNSAVNYSVGITRVFLVATVISYVGVITTGVILVIRSFPKINEAAEPVFDILYRFHYVNNVANPIVYGFMDGKFRRQCKYLYKKGFQKIRKCLNFEK